MSVKKIFTTIFCLSLGLFVAQADSVNFISKPMTVGKALLADNAYSISHLLDIANFSPELRLPVQLVYNSFIEKSGLFGFAWRSPQLESSAYYDKDGVLWITPWGERIKFFPKDEKQPKDAIKVELYEQAKKGSGFFAPYSEWEADIPKYEYVKSGHWIFRGKRDKVGWIFTYRDFRLKTITAPSGRSIEFNYDDKRLVSITQGGKKFVELSYSKDMVSSLKINGIVHDFNYGLTKLQILPKTEKGSVVSVSRNCLVSIKRGDLLPKTFTYDDYGFLNSIKQGAYTDNILVEHQTLAERLAELKFKKDRKIKYDGPANGRILSDNQFQYTYSSLKPGSIDLSDKLNQKASYRYDIQTGVFKVSEFSGKNYAVYYFMRHDVAYLGKVRKIVDGKGRDLLNYRYDKLSGDVIRVRDLVGNDINFEYGKNGKLSLISRRAANQDTAEPVKSFGYDRFNNLTDISNLDAQGKSVVTTSLSYNKNRDVISISNGQIKNQIIYNTFGYPTKVLNVFGQYTQREMDDYNRMVSNTDFYGVKTYYTYSPAGLISKIERKDDEKLLNSLSITYNGNGQPVRYVDQSGKVKEFERDAFGRVVKELFPDDTEVAYAYNELGQLHTVLDQNKHQITFDWNKFGLDAKTTPAGQLTDYVHDGYGLLTSLDSRKGEDRARSIKYTYDEFDRLIELDYGNGDIETRTYDSWGKLLTTQRGENKERYKYDYFGRLTSKIGTKEKLYIAYNPYGQRIGRKIESNGVKMLERRSYDEYGRLIKISSGGKALEYIYNDNNQIHQQIINGSIIEFTYTKYGQLKSKRMIKNNKTLEKKGM